MIGKTISHYKILEKIGEGGMGVVYKAEDTKLRRTVALKFLPEDLTKDAEAKERFLQEAQAAAALDHPNICTIYEINESGRKTFISMAYIEGQSLKEIISAGPMGIDQAIGIAIQITEGLREAHERGVVHRDVKPANIILTEKGQAKIMDFGLAKLSWGVDLTKTATIMGTVAYMSPEQARGKRVDHRTDIWSLGITLYEMIAGERPFKRELEPAVIYAIITEEPQPLTEIRPDVPKQIDNAIQKALEKDPNCRYQTISDFGRDLRRTSSLILAPTRERKSVVVLPFENISPDKENEYFSDGLTEEIIADLSQVRNVKVISRTSAMRLKGTDKDLKTIGQELNVQFALEGSVRKVGDNIRVTAQLIDAKDDVHLWADKYSGTLEDVFDIQEKVSRSIVDALKVELSPKEDAKIADRPIENVKAYECYLQARQEIWRFTEDGLERGLQLIRNGLEIVGENALLYSAMGTAFYIYVDAGIKPGEYYLQKTDECAQKIFTLDPESSHGYFLRGAVHVLRGDMQQAVRDLKRALAVDPNNPDVLLQLIRIYASCGKISAAEPLLERALELDPLNTLTYSLPGYLELLKGRFDSAAESYHKMYLMDSQNPIAQWFYGWSLIFAQRSDEAFAIIDKLAEDFPSTVFATYGLFIKNALEGKKAEALQLITPELEATAKGVEYHSRDMAHGYALLGEKDKALEWLENAVDRGFINYPFIAEIDPFFVSLRDEDRFKKLLERIKLEWESFEV
ncbi:MAG: protein kinase [Candidatus Aminicenantaceae bacterium]